MGPSDLKSAHYFISASCPDRCRIYLEVIVWSLRHVRHVACSNLFRKILELQGIVYFWNTFDCISSLRSCGWKMWFSLCGGSASPQRCEWKIDVGLGLSVFRSPPFFASEEGTRGLGVKNQNMCDHFLSYSYLEEGTEICKYPYGIAPHSLSLGNWIEKPLFFFKCCFIL